MSTIETVARTLLTSRRKAIQKLFHENSDEEKHLQEQRETDWPDRALAYETATLLGRLTDTERRELRDIDASRLR